MRRAARAGCAGCAAKMDKESFDRLMEIFICSDAQKIQVSVGFLAVFAKETCCDVVCAEVGHADRDVAYPPAL